MRHQYWLFKTLLGLSLLTGGCDEDPGKTMEGELDGGNLPGDGDGDPGTGDGDLDGDRDSGTDGGGLVDNLPPLTQGSRVYEHIVNLVDPELANALTAYMSNRIDQDPVPGEDGADLDLPVRAFLQYYRDEYDFIVFAADHDISPEIDGLFQRVDSPNIPGTGVERYHHHKFPHGRLMGAIGVDTIGPDERAPLAHEVVHYWANHLDPAIGFGDAFKGGRASHWGSTSVHGQLGGFDGASLRCAKPQGAMPPACTAETNGKIRYETSWFSPLSAVESEIFYAPLELYLMGLIPRSDLPTSYVKLIGASPDPVSFVGQNKIIVEATGVGQISVQSIVNTHGPRALALEAERHFTMAIVVLTAKPASDAFMKMASGWAESFGDHAPTAAWPSFKAMTGGRATMETRLGARRRPEDPAANPRPEPAGQCDVLTQNCQGGLGCYDPDQPVCLPSKGGALGDPCSAATDCAPGLDCSGFDVRLCAPYCDANNSASPKACDALCPEAFIEIADSTVPTQIAGTLCYAGSGAGACDPLAQECEAGFGCYGREGTNCLPEGDLPLYAACTPLGNPCAPGAECIGILGGNGNYCQPYCNPAAGAQGPDACATLCPGYFWDYHEDAYAICIPDQ